MIKIIDNVIDQDRFAALQAQIMSPRFPWYFTNSTSYYRSESEIQSNLEEFQFNHQLIVDGKLISPVANEILFVAETAAFKANIEIDSYTRLMLVCSLFNKNLIFPPHVDHKVDHKVMIYYINSCEGDTVIYNEKYDQNSPYDIQEYYNIVLNKHLTVKEKIKPLENRAVLFDGLHYHSGQSPTDTQRRILTNIGFIAKV